MARSTDDQTRRTGETHQDRDAQQDRTAVGQESVHGGIPTGTPQQPALDQDESHFMPDTGDNPTPERPDEDLIEEARDGFMNRYPPRGQTD